MNNIIANILSSSINGLLPIACAISLILNGCAPKKGYLTRDEKSSMGALSIAVTTEALDVRFGSLLSENAMVGATKGSAVGCLVGLHPFFLCGGGSPFLAPYAALSFSSCSRGLQAIDEPKQSLRRDVLEQNPSLLVYQEASDALFKFTGTKPIRIDYSVKPVSANNYDISPLVNTEVDTIVQFEELHFILEAILGDINKCPLILSLETKWVVIRTKDGAKLMTASSDFTADKVFSIKEFYDQNTGLQETLVLELVKELSEDVVHKLTQTEDKPR